MQHVTLKYSALYLALGFVCVVIFSFLIEKIGIEVHSQLLSDILKGVFLILTTTIIFYILLGHVSKTQLENKNQYKRLFEENPNPMWVYDLDSLAILAVNQAAMHTYGYSREEFLALSIKDLRPKTETEKLIQNLKDQSPVYSNSGNWLHKRKNGEEFFVTIYSHRTQFNKRRTRLVLALDINDRLIAEQRIVAQNERLREIAHLQSHNVRRPVASIMGLINLFDKKNPTSEINSIVIDKLDIVCKELDLTIHKIVEKTYELEVEQQEQKL